MQYRICLLPACATNGWLLRLPGSWKQGDNNQADDRVLYVAGQKWLNRKHIMGRVVGCGPVRASALAQR